MNFRDLEYVVAVSKTLSFSKAAEACHVSQPSLSAQIKKLETELQNELFVRTKRKIHLSTFGKVFVQKAEDILTIRDDIKKAAAKNQDPMKGSIKIGAILTVAPYLFPQIVQTLKDKAPKIELRLKEAKTEELISDLLCGNIDIAILSLPTDDHIFDTHALLTEPFYIAVPKEHALSQNTSITGDMLKDHSLILLEEGHCFRDQALDVCHSALATENKMFEATSLETIRQFIAAEDGITLVPAMAKKDNDGLAYIPLCDQNFQRVIGLAWRPSCNKKAQIQSLIHILDDANLST